MVIEPEVEVMELEEALGDCYRGKRVFLTGHTGFKGTWLLLLLKSLGAEVRGYSLAPDPGSLYAGVGGDDICQSTIADIRDADRLKNEVLEYSPDFIFHFAAQPLVLAAYADPVYTYATNVMGTVNLLDSARHLERGCCLVLATTDKVYENKEWVYPYRETDRLGGFDPYSSSKACTELAVASFRRSYFPTNGSGARKSIGVVRAGNVIGGGDWAENRIVPDIVRALTTDTEIVLRSPAAVRPWQHVLDALVGYLLLGTKLAAHATPDLWSDAWNFGPHQGRRMCVREVVEMAISIWGKGSYRVDPATTLHEANMLQLDCSKASAMLGWTPRLSAEQAIELTIRWYRSVIEESQSPMEITATQISAYFE